jgi:hypothetical protein
MDPQFDLLDQKEWSYCSGDHSQSDPLGGVNITLVGLEDMRWETLLCLCIGDHVGTKRGSWVLAGLVKDRAEGGSRAF